MGAFFVILESPPISCSNCYSQGVPKTISLDNDLRSVNFAGLHTMSYTPDTLHRDSHKATLLERIACTDCTYWTEQLGNNCRIYKRPVPHEALSKTVVSCCSAQHSGLYSTLLNTLVHMYLDTILDRLEEEGVLEVAWGSTLALGEVVGTDCSMLENKLESIALGMLQDMLVAG